MSEVPRETTPLVGLVIPDSDKKRVLLTYRSDHLQWQLTGGRIRGEGSTDQGIAELAAVRHAREKLGIGIPIDYMEPLDTVEFDQGDVGYSMKLYLVQEFGGWPLLQGHEHYSRLDYHNLSMRKAVGDMALSASVKHVAMLQHDNPLLLSGPNTVQ